MASTVNIDLIRANDQSLVANIATAVANSGQFSWTVPTTISPGGQYLIRVTRADNHLADTSNASFTITPPIHTYYVNDGSVNFSGDWTTAPGDDTNDGLSPAKPKASIRAVLQAYSPGAGDTIFVDAGSYALASNLVIPAADFGRPDRRLSRSGVSARAAVLDRGNQNAGSYTIELQAASGVTLDHLSLTGGNAGVYAADNAAAGHLTVSNSEIYGNLVQGVFLGLTNDNAVIIGNRIHDQTAFYAFGIQVTSSAATVSGNTLYLNGNDSDSGYGIWINGADGLVTGNQTYSQTTGIHADYGGDVAYRITVSNNLVHGNARTGIEAGSAVLVTGNSVYWPDEPRRLWHQQLHASAEIASIRFTTMTMASR